MRVYTDGFEILDESDIPRLLPPRPRDVHKGDCGHALIIAGAVGMAGAACLAANAALRGGAGLVSVACPREIVPVVQTLAPCAMCVPRGDAMLEGKSAFAIGPGLGRSIEAENLIDTLIGAPLPQVWDADALNLLAKNPRPLGTQAAMTPHPGEAARLLGTTTADVRADPHYAAVSLHRKFGAAVLLKGAQTVIVDGARRGLNLRGTPGMATGGSGDVLTGLIAALLAQGLSRFDALHLGAFLHALAGEAAAEARGVRSMIATDIVEALRIG